MTKQGGYLDWPATAEARPTSYDVKGGVATITLDQPDTKNALSVSLMNSLGDNLARAAEDPECRLVVLTNTGHTFCAGADLKRRPDGAGGAAEELRWPLERILAAIMDHPKPVIGKIAGHCMGGGVGLAAACDLSIAASDAQFGFTEVRIGVAPAIISVVCLPKMRMSDAMRLFLTGERIVAGRAVAVGLINSTTIREELDHAVERLCGSVMMGGPSALSAAKQLVRRVPGMERTSAFEWTAELSAYLFQSDEAREGITAFRERRHPNWVPDDWSGPRT